MTKAKDEATIAALLSLDLIEKRIILTAVKRLMSNELTIEQFIEQGTVDLRRYRAEKDRAGAMPQPAL